MSHIYAVIGPITTAVRLSKELSKHRIPSKVVHTPGNNGGCSYSVMTDESRYELLVSLSERYRIKQILKSDSDL